MLLAVLLVARDVVKLDYISNLSVLMNTCGKLAVISKLCPCCYEVAIYTFSVTYRENPCLNRSHAAFNPLSVDNPLIYL